MKLTDYAQINRPRLGTRKLNVTHFAPSLHHSAVNII